MAACRSTSTSNAAVAQQVDQILGGDVAAGARGERAAAEPADRRVQPRDTRVTAAYALASPAPRVLWKCAPSGMSPITRADLGDKVGHAPRRGGADGVGDRDAVDADVGGRRGDVEDALRRRRAVERAVPCGGDDHLDRRAAVVGDAR